ncbi:MAG: hypothetical protein JO076_15815 [Verrucomicrobia bacterium]|nr:hypothetical protein [Verrucomicrobiota bacterium]
MNYIQALIDNSLGSRRASQYNNERIYENLELLNLCGVEIAAATGAMVSVTIKSVCLIYEDSLWIKTI